MAVFPAVRAKEDRCENPASATLRVFGIVGYRDQLAELAAGLAAGDEQVRHDVPAETCFRLRTSVRIA